MAAGAILELFKTYCYPCAHKEAADLKKKKNKNGKGWQSLFVTMVNPIFFITNVFLPLVEPKRNRPGVNQL